MATRSQLPGAAKSNRVRRNAGLQRGRVRSLHRLKAHLRVAAPKRWYHESTIMSESKDQPLHASTSEAVTNNVRVEVESQYAPEHSQPFQKPVVLLLHRPHHERRRGDRPAAQPPLDHHRRDRPHRGSRGPGVVGEQPVLAPRRVVSVHIGLSVEDVDRRDARHLPDGHRRTATTSTSRSRHSRCTNPTPFTEIPATTPRLVQRRAYRSRHIPRPAPGTPRPVLRTCRAASSRARRR